MAEHDGLKSWVNEMAELCCPDQIIWIDGSEIEKTRLENEAVSSGELVKLHDGKYPGCFFHRSAVNDVARSEHLTYICTRNKDDSGPNNNWLSPEEGYRRAGEIFRNSMRGRKMFVIPFSMGVVGSPFSKIGVQLTDSIYVVLNMRIMTRVGNAVIESLGTSGEFTKCLHGKANLDDKRRLILHFPEDNTIWSVGSGYGGNALLGKKCLSLRISSWKGKQEGWLAEHMLIMGIEDPSGKIDYVAAAFPSACGKSNLAMMIPPESYRKKGYKVWTVGDDIAWLRIGSDGRLWAINPEAGFFFVAPGTNSKSNPNALAAIRKNAIFTNVVLGGDRTVWWEFSDDPVPENSLDWRGMPFKEGMKDPEGNPILGANPNSRFTAPAHQCPSISPRWEDPEGVPISAILFGGRRERLAPLVCESFDWNHGVYLGATIASERTAAAFGKVGEIRRDPMAMLPFCGYNMADYFGHWLNIGQRLLKPPKIFHVNWFRRDENGEYLWPGFGENLRVLEWILSRCRGVGPSVETPIGLMPKKEHLNLSDLDLSGDRIESLLKVCPDEWREELKGHREFFEKFGPRLPEEMWRQHHNLRERLESCASAATPQENRENRTYKLIPAE